MNREFAENWLNRLKQYWFNKEIENVENYKLQSLINV